ncbi:MAG: two-component system, NarL family, nitrate/nitrite response regulator NarL [Solirubrobacteraceae bacterium]|nr:two-component system, NarL family, nitrate/nitrite response regulator NarL [Solirubrobacteraceae bacterium]
MADDHPLYRRAVTEAIKSRADLEFVAEAGDGRAVLEIIRAEQPDVALLDIRMPELDGLEVLNAVVRDNLPTRIVFLTAHVDSASAYAAVGAGAAGYLAKEASAETICDAIAAVSRGETVLAPEVQAGIAREIRLRSGEERPVLTGREREILALTADGHSAPDIAEKLTLSPTTVRTHLQHLYDKLGVSDRAAAVAEAMRRGLLE